MPIIHSQKTTLNAPVVNRYYRVDRIELRQRLSRAGQEGRADNNAEIQLPVENGVMQSFQLLQSPVMAPALAARYPDIQTYKVKGIDNPYASGRISLSPAGFHGMITSPAGSLFIDPQGDEIYRTSTNPSSPAQPFSCGVKGQLHDAAPDELAHRNESRKAGSIRVYRLALAATAEYSAKFGGTKSGTLEQMAIAMNRVNQIFERDLAIRLLLIDNNDKLIYTDKANDPYTDPFTDIQKSGANLLAQNQKNIRAVIGSANYDIGHLFSLGGGGLAQVGVVCKNGDNNSGDLKAAGVTGTSNPVGDAFYIDYVAHEMGHQFAAEHTFSGSSKGCGDGNRYDSSAFEPGSGSSIMSYAGICGTENISAHANATFHAGSINKINSYMGSGTGSSCGSSLLIDNPGQPTANAGKDFTIPAQTPFMLTAAGSDPDITDAVTYSWDQMDAGLVTNSTTFGTDSGKNSLFRTYLSRAVNERHFPALGTTVSNKYDYSEVLACQSRNINFRLTVLDGNSGIASDDVRITVDGNSGPFEITSHGFAQTLSSGTDEEIKWNVANTNQAPVNCGQVDISLLTFNSQLTSYSETLLSSGEANDGGAIVFIPFNSSSKARFKIQCSDNIFYDISDADLILDGGIASTSNEKTVFYNKAGANYSVKDISAEICQLNPESDDSSGGLGSLNLYWLFGLVSLLITRRQVLLAVSQGLRP